MRQRLRTLLVVVIVLAVAGPAAARSLRDTLSNASTSVGIQSGTAFDALADAIANTAANNLPVISASAGFTYRYNPELEVFERSAETLGPIFLERPETLGRGKFNVNVELPVRKFNSYDGTDLEDLEGPGPVVLRIVDAAGNLQGFEADDLEYRLKLRNHVAAFSFTYGVLDNLDVNVLLPAHPHGARLAGRPAAGPDRRTRRHLRAQHRPAITGSSDDSKTGVGDLLLRTKYQLPRADWLRSAFGPRVPLPHRRRGQLPGHRRLLGHAGLLRLHLSVGSGRALRERRRRLQHQRLAPDPGPLRRRRRYRHRSRSASCFAFLGRSQISDPVEPGETDFLYLLPTGQTARRPLLGIDLGRKDFFDLSFGMRAVVWRSVMLFANAIYALNDDGLRDDNFIPTFGIEGTF